MHQLGLAFLTWKVCTCACLEGVEEGGWRRGWRREWRRRVEEGGWRRKDGGAYVAHVVHKCIGAWLLELDN